MTDEQRVIEILLVEDNTADAALTRESLADAAVANRVTTVKDGVDAMALLRNQEPYANSPRPDLVLLDLNMPRMDGRRVLEQVKADPKLRSIPVIVMSTSRAEKDVADAYDLQASAFVAKPIDIDEFLAAMRKVHDFWLAIVKYPGRSRL